MPFKLHQKQRVRLHVTLDRQGGGFVEINVSYQRGRSIEELVGLRWIDRKATSTRTCQDDQNPYPDCFKVYASSLPQLLHDLWFCQSFEPPSIAASILYSTLKDGLKFPSSNSPRHSL